ncbi:Sir2 family NAD-dependent protein deacetylase [Undibacterium cyanobacteriorum]|uniref:protein acetyllysine N-acetyltransferase n=1 Tax=Undibacterium cyanobacteriorum TaxID=3073561 RepID=A0ABY9RLK3_9BURK|nr:Sir2 family NAD-dependent protein deacetylase [Undibacterium sp. 20NA77.5]WMW82100.1 Sir2 family NAD-dependent protein deacetylase [Undibacterium sp. 20NA77.5]
MTIPADENQIQHQHQIQENLDAAAELIAEADAVLVCSGAGIGIDSGLPDFRGDNGFWNAYPALGTRGISFVEIANPQAFRQHPRLAWGFYGHRLQLYRQVQPHLGFSHLLRLAKALPLGMRHFTSNVDGQFQKAGFASEHVVECHGSIHYLQCSRQCGNPAWPATGFEPEIDEAQCLLLSELPVCPVCGGLARPNILMFGDWDFEGDRYQQAQDRLLTWFARSQRAIVIEIGAGTAIPSARRFGAALDVPLIRINPGEPGVARSRDVSIATGAQNALTRLVELLKIT